MPHFGDERVNPEFLRRGAPLRWGAVGPNIIPLTAAELDFPVADEIIEAVREHAASGVFGYGSPEGSPSLRSVASDVLRERHEVKCDPEQIAVTLGTAAGIWAVVRLLCGPGDECVIFDPVDLLFAMAVEASGATLVRCPMDVRSGSIDIPRLRALVNGKTRLICLCNPHNPLGAVASRDELEAIADLALEHDIAILSDEVWSEIVFEPAKHTSVAALGSDIAARTYTLFGPSKTFGIPGFRVGFVGAPNQHAVRALNRVALGLGTAFGLSPIAEVAAETAFRCCWSWRDAFVAHLRKQRDIAAIRLNAMPGVRCRIPDATYVLFPDISATGMTSAEFAAFALNEAQVALVPGTEAWFGPGAEGHVRISFATSGAILEEALSRLLRALIARP
jgi:aspartate/methionine/tyrosine aminotransferase